jgi:hypothetical protein
MNIISERYKDLRSMSARFLEAKPFPHLVLDKFLDESFFEELCKVTQAERKAESGRKFDTQHEKSKWISINDSLPERLSQLIGALNSEEWVANLQSLSGLPELVGTQCGNSQLGNYHLMEPGGFLAPHVDHSSEPKTGLPHVLNIILYLTDRWNDEYGGSTTLYDRVGKYISAEVKYCPNRAVIFMHTPYSFHCVEEIGRDIPVPRKTLYVDYYSRSFEPYRNLKLPFPNKWFYHGTTFRLPHWYDYLLPRNYSYSKAMLRYQLNRINS